MKLNSLWVVLLVATAVFGQTAKVIAIDESDTAQMKRLVAQRDALDQQIKDFHDRIADKYLLTETPGSCTIKHKDEGKSASWSITSGSGVIYGGSIDYRCPTEEEKAAQSRAEKKSAEERKQWLKDHPALYSKWGGCSTDFEFSEDYRFIVPPAPKPQPQYQFGGLIVPPTMLTTQ